MAKKKNTPPKRKPVPQKNTISKRTSKPSVRKPIRKDKPKAIKQTPKVINKPVKRAPKRDVLKDYTKAQATYRVMAKTAKSNKQKEQYRQAEKTMRLLAKLEAKPKTEKQKVKSPTDKQKQEYRNLYQKVWRKKQKKDELKKGKKGYKTERSKLYKEIIELNEQLRDYGQKIGVKSAIKKKKPVIHRHKSDEVARIETESMVAWEFEDELHKYIKSKKLKFIIIAGKSYDIRKLPPHVIIQAYDKARDDAYSQLMATTPVVNSTINYNSKTLTIDFNS